MSVFRVPSVFSATLAATVLVLVTPLPARAANWHAVIVGQNETIEIDKERIARGFSGTTGWSRIILGREVNDPGGAYNAIHAQNLYDCSGRRFTTLRRAYFNGDTLVREESVSRQRANKIQIGSIDERLLNEACGAHAGAEESAGRCKVCWIRSGRARCAPTCALWMKVPGRGSSRSPMPRQGRWHRLLPHRRPLPLLHQRLPARNHGTFRCRRLTRRRPIRRRPAPG
jgi:hypothetical protein